MRSSDTGYDLVENTSQAFPKWLPKWLQCALCELFEKKKRFGVWKFKFGMCEVFKLMNSASSEEITYPESSVQRLSLAQL